MKVFISWSGPQSQKVAESLANWLKFVIQSVQPFVSSTDIAKGDRSLRVIADQLKDTSFGIVCVTRENNLAPWINFEAGALSKTVGEALVIPFLLDIPADNLTGPLAQFQAVSSTSKNDVFALIRALRDKANLIHPDLTHLDDAHLKDTFDTFWSRLADDLKSIRDRPGITAVESVRNPSEVWEEILFLARRQDGVLRTIIERVDSSIPMQELNKKAGGSNDKPDERRELVDALIATLGVLGDSALTYRVITDRTPVEVQVVYAADAISASNIDDARAGIEAFIRRHGVRVTVKSEDGYQIIAGPGKETVLLSPAASAHSDPKSGESEP